MKEFIEAVVEELTPLCEKVVEIMSTLEPCDVCITCECGHLEIDIDAVLPEEITEYVCHECGGVIIYEPPQENNHAKNNGITTRIY